jgi:glycosyltransferase involved in cell wall biosynthesis
MRIGISLLDFQPRNSGGIESYVRDLIEGLQKIEISDDFVIIMNWHNKGEIRVKSNNFSIEYADHRRLYKKVLHKVGVRGHSGKDQILRTLEGLGLDVILYPLQHIPLGLEDYTGKFVVSIMDIQHEYYKAFFKKDEYLARNKQYREACERAEKIISISDFTKRTLIEKYNIDAKKITTIYLSFNPSRVSQKCSNNEYGKYFFYPAATWPHKNHLHLIRAFKQVSKTYPEFKLVLAGIKKQNEYKVMKEINKLGLSDVVIRLGYVDDSRLAELFTNAFALVFPSLFEGFGIPVLEAMSVGVPTVISNTTSLPEVGGDATLYFDPNSVNDIANKMITIIKDDNLRARLVKKGLKQVEKFSIQKMSEETYKLLIKVANEKR